MKVNFCLTRLKKDNSGKQKNAESSVKKRRQLFMFYSSWLGMIYVKVLWDGETAMRILVVNVPSV